VDAELVRLYGGILGYGSADEDTDAYLVQALGERAISFQEAPCPAFCGEDTHSVVGVFADSAAISAYAKEHNIDQGGTPDLQGMLFSEQVPAGGTPAEQVNVLFNYYNRAEWKFDAASGTYLRWIEQMEGDENEGDLWMIPLVDRVTGQQLAFDNVIILFAHYIEDSPSRYEIEIMKNIEGNGLSSIAMDNGSKDSGKCPTINRPSNSSMAPVSPSRLNRATPGSCW
jgi:hypothetical protein